MNKRCQGFIDPLTLIGVGFLLVTLFFGVKTVANPNLNQNINEKAAGNCTCTSPSGYGSVSGTCSATGVCTCPSGGSIIFNGCSANPTSAPTPKVCNQTDCLERCLCQGNAASYCGSLCAAPTAPPPTETCGPIGQPPTSQGCCPGLDLVGGLCQILITPVPSLPPTPVPTPTFTPSPTPICNQTDCYQKCLCQGNNASYCGSLCTAPTATPTSCGQIGQLPTSKGCCPGLILSGNLCSATPKPTPTVTTTPTATPTPLPSPTPICNQNDCYQKCICLENTASYCGSFCLSTTATPASCGVRGQTPTVQGCCAGLTVIGGICQSLSTATPTARPTSPAISCLEPCVTDSDCGDTTSYYCEKPVSACASCKLRAAVCIPESKRCSGNWIETCNPFGSGWEATQDCDRCSELNGNISCSQKICDNYGCYTCPENTILKVNEAGGRYCLGANGEVLTVIVSPNPNLNPNLKDLGESCHSASECQSGNCDSRYTDPDGETITLFSRKCVISLAEQSVYLERKSARDAQTAAYALAGTGLAKPLINVVNSALDYLSDVYSLAQAGGTVTPLSLAQAASLTQIPAWVTTTGTVLTAISGPVVLATCEVYGADSPECQNMALSVYAGYQTLINSQMTDKIATLRLNNSTTLTEVTTNQALSTTSNPYLDKPYTKVAVANDGTVYYLYDSVGEGEFGQVYAAVNSCTNELCVVKLPKATALELDQNMLADEFAFLQRANQAISDRGLPTSLVPKALAEVTTTEGAQGYAMEYVAGNTLKATIQQQGSVLTEAQIKQLTQDADLLDLAGVHLSNISPTNIIVNENGTFTYIDLNPTLYDQEGKFLELGFGLGGNKYFTTPGLPNEENMTNFVTFIKNNLINTAENNPGVINPAPLNLESDTLVQ